MCCIMLLNMDVFSLITADVYGANRWSTDGKRYFLISESSKTTIKTISERNTNLVKGLFKKREMSFYKQAGVRKAGNGYLQK